jgi:hypothetical protein
MGGCTNCAGKSGCNDRKGTMFHALDRELARLYPTRTWGEPDDLARFEAGIAEEDGHALAEELAVALDAATFYRPGEPDEYCDYIYVLCLGREPCLVQIRDGEVPLPGELRDDLSGIPIQEQYLRVCLSHMARVAGVQQTAMELHRAGRDHVVRELPRAGVYDAPLLRRFQRLVAVLPAYDIVHLDFGEISAPLAGFEPGAYPRLYGSLPHAANYLFYPQPSTMQTTCLLPG